MVECEFCGENVDSPFTCNFCGGAFCGKHRLPPNHDCPNIGAWRSRSGPGLGDHEKKVSWLAGGEKPEVKKVTSAGWWSKSKLAVVIIIVIIAIILYLYL